MSGYKQDTKLMAKNTAFMYIQMAVKMLIGLYTVRVILHALGEEDYGIYNVVGGFVTMFSFITNTLVSASQRFFAYSIGRGEKEMLNRFFNSSFLSFIILSVILFLLIEAIGYWFVNYKMVVPVNRLVAANWVFQFAVFAFIVRILSVPFRAMVVSHEKMIIFAIISVLDSLMILGIAFLVQSVSTDKLKFYAVCMFGVAVLTTFLYVILCERDFPEDSKIRIRWEGSLMKEMLSYCGWYMFGTMALMVRSQGINMILNVFFGPVVNAARGIAYQINNAINQFVNSFFNAVRPQITKLTAADEKDKMLSLVYSSSVISFLLMCLIAVPLLIEMPFILSLWLGEVPEYTIIFSRLVVITAMIDTLGNPLSTAVNATGNIKNFQVITGILLILNLPVSFFLLKVWTYPYVAFYVSIVLSFIVQIVRMAFMKQMFGMPILGYTREVVVKVLAVSIISILTGYFLRIYLGTSIWAHLTVVFISVGMVLILSWCYAIKKSQRDYFMSMIAKRKVKRL